MNCCYGLNQHTYTGWCLMRPVEPEPLAQWERELLRGPHKEGYGDVTFTLDNDKNLTIEDVRVDSISDNGSNSRIIAAELDNGSIIHIPWVAYWTVEYIV